MSTRLEALISRAAPDEREAEFAACVAQNQQRVFRIACSVLGNAADAEEIAQEAFLRAFRRFSLLRDPGKFRAWVGRIVFRLALNRHRARRRQLARDTAWHGAQPESTGDAARGAFAQFDLQRLRTEIDRLPEKLRVVLLLSAVEEMDAREVACLLNLPAGTVRSRLHLARKRLIEVWNP